MEITITKTTFLCLITLLLSDVKLTNGSEILSHTRDKPKINPLESVLLDRNAVYDKNMHIRVKRQYDPYYRRLPIPIIIGGGGIGFGGPGFGGRGFGGRGFGGGGFGGRGFGGRGFGGRGFGGRGFGGRGFGGGFGRGVGGFGGRGGRG